ncbi:MAG: lipolytic protein family [Ilumatobacteraceae bacterium]|nr:lipolytic protein family [Ilumatobacteraceae bacterium]
MGVARLATVGGMSDALRSPAVEAFIRGAAWPAGAATPYPRADPADHGRLPIDTWGTACLPVGVRLELIGDAAAVDIAYVTATEDLGYRGAGAGTTFNAWRGGQLVDQQPVALGSGTARIALGEAADGAADPRVTIYLPEGMRPTILSLTAVDGSISPAPEQPRWIAYGDSIAEGWIASGPDGAWPAIASRLHGLDVVNLGYAGSARGELVSAQQIAALASPAVISITHGTNCWTRIPHSVDQMVANTSAFLAVVRAGHPGVPIVVASPIVRPDGEATPNLLGATHADIRDAMERATRAHIATGDDLMTLIPGGGVLDPGLLGDGVHPGDDGHRVLARVFGDAVAAALASPIRT